MLCAEHFCITIQHSLFCISLEIGATYSKSLCLRSSCERWNIAPSIISSLRFWSLIVVISFVCIDVVHTLFSYSTIRNVYSAPLLLKNQVPSDLECFELNEYLPINNNKPISNLWLFFRSFAFFLSSLTQIYHFSSDSHIYFFLVFCQIPADNCKPHTANAPYFHVHRGIKKRNKMKFEM